jgi:hypothetical protein
MEHLTSFPGWQLSLKKAGALCAYINGKAFSQGLERHK